MMIIIIQWNILYLNLLYFQKIQKDAKVAKEMMRYVLWKDVKERERRKKRRRMNNNEADSDEESSEEEEDSEEEVPLSDM